MLRAVLTRQPSADYGTFGVMSVDGKTYQTLELPWRDNVKQLSCIPSGNYVCRIVNSPRFGRVYGVTNVKGRSNILIHGGNLAGDITKGYDTNVQGCILLFKYKGFIKNKKGVLQRAGLVSQPALREFMKQLNGASFELEIT